MASASSEISPPLSPWVGWGMVLFFGFAFSITTHKVASLEARVMGVSKTSEAFATAGRNVGMGLVASSIVSSWTWTATLLQSSNMAWKVGIAGSYWYAAGACVQIMLFAVLAVHVKRRARNIRTFMEIIKIRWGKAAHAVFLMFAALTNMIVSGMLILGGAATLRDLTGMSTFAACFLLPVVSCLPYTLAGGLRATLVAHWFNTIGIFVALWIFAAVVFLGGDHGYWGNPNIIFNKLTEASRFAVMEHTRFPSEFNSTVHPAGGMSSFILNRGYCVDHESLQTLEEACSFEKLGTDDYCDGCLSSFDFSTSACRGSSGDCISISATEHFVSKDCESSMEMQSGQRRLKQSCAPSFMTMTSVSGLIFGVVNLIGNFGTVFVDQSYWQGAIASNPAKAADGFILGGIVWFSVPMAMATTMGLAGRALLTDATLPHGSGYISLADSNHGLTPARVVAAIMPHAGPWILLVMMFMAIVSTGSSEIIAISTLFTYDVYAPYVHPELSERRLRLRSLFFRVVAGKEQDLNVEEAMEVSTWRIVSTALPQLLERLQDAGFFLVRPQADLLQELSGESLVVEEFYAFLNVRVNEPQELEGKLLLRIMKISTVVFSVIMGFVAVSLDSVGLSLGFVYLAMGIFVGPAVLPCALALLMERANGHACTLGALIGLLGGIAAWILTAEITAGQITISSLGMDLPMLAGNVTSISLSGLLGFAGSLLFPDTSFKWAYLNFQLPLIDDLPEIIDEIKQQELSQNLRRKSRKTLILSLLLFVLLLLGLPVPLYVSGAILGTSAFAAWVFVILLWSVAGGLVVIFLPIVNSYQQSLQTKAVQGKFEQMNSPSDSDSTDADS